MDTGSGPFRYSAIPPLESLKNWSQLPFGAEYGTNRTLPLDSHGMSSRYSCNFKGTKRKWIDTKEIKSPEQAALVLGLGRSPSSSGNSRVSSATLCTMSSAKEITDDESSVDLGLKFELQLGCDYTFSPKKQIFPATTTMALESGPDLNLSLSTGQSESVVTSIPAVSVQHQNNMVPSAETIQVIATEGEGSDSSLRKIGSHVVPPLYTSGRAGSFPIKEKTSVKADKIPFTPDFRPTMMQMPKSPVACNSGIVQLQQRNTNSKGCQYPGCGKGARGASGLCIAHGGGRRCQKAGCHKGAEGRTVYCKAHGGGRRCEYLGCTKSAEGRTDFCIAHGGGRRCSHEECSRAARGKSGLCIRHGGGKRCQRENCTKSAEGYTGLCISHGGGRRCQYPACTKGAQGSTMFCKAHGGGKRCTVLGCTKGAEGSTAFCKGHGGGKRCSFHGGGVCPKSVHGGTLFCVAHGGGKRCAVSDCSKSARGRTDFCVRHGGGKRCKSEGCGKSAQGSTDFCKAHGGGKRCAWGQVGSDFGAGEPPCDRFARGKSGLCAAHSALVQDQCVHGVGTLGPPIANFSQTIKSENVKDGATARESFMGWSGIQSSDSMKNVLPGVAFDPNIVSVPEGRVHGGSILAILTGNAGVDKRYQNQARSGISDQVFSYSMLHL